MSFCFWVNNVFRWILLLYPSEWVFLPLDLQRNYLPCYWWDEGEGRQRRVLPLCCYVGGSGCGSEMQGAGNYCPAHQAEGHWWKQVRPWMNKTFTVRDWREMSCWWHGFGFMGRKNLCLHHDLFVPFSLKNQDTRTRGTVCPQGSGSFWHEDRPYRYVNLTVSSNEAWSLFSGLWIVFHEEV